MYLCTLYTHIHFHTGCLPLHADACRSMLTLAVLAQLVITQSEKYMIVNIINLYVASTTSCRLLKQSILMFIFIFKSMFILIK